MKIVTFLSTTESIVSDYVYSSVIIEISKIVLLDTNLGLHFFWLLSFVKMLHFGICVQVKRTFQIIGFISMVSF